MAYIYYIIHRKSSPPRDMLLLHKKAQKRTCVCWLFFLLPSRLMSQPPSVQERLRQYLDTNADFVASPFIQSVCWHHIPELGIPQPWDRENQPVSPQTFRAVSSSDPHLSSSNPALRLPKKMSWTAFVFSPPTATSSKSMVFFTTEDLTNFLPWQSMIYLSRSNPSSITYTPCASQTYISMISAPLSHDLHTNQSFTKAPRTWPTLYSPVWRIFTRPPNPSFPQVLAFS